VNEMDLIPGEFRRGLTLRRTISRFIWALLIVLGLVAAARATLGYLVWREKTQVMNLEQRQQLLTQSQTQADSLRQQRLVTQQQLATLDQLKGSDRVAQFLRSIDEAYIERIWLDSVHFHRPGDASRYGWRGSVARRRDHRSRIQSL
jgi:cell division protein FtsB